MTTANFIEALHRTLRDAHATKRGLSDSRINRIAQACKTYERMPQIPLPRGPVDVVLTKRISSPDSNKKRKPRFSVSLENVGFLTQTLAVDQEDLIQFEHSETETYPIELYLLGDIGTNTSAVFHYRSTEHTLEHLWQISSKISLQNLCTPVVDSFGEPSAILILTSLTLKGLMIQGDSSYQLMLLKVGHAARNILLTAEALNLEAHTSISFNERLVLETLDLMHTDELILYTIAIYQHTP